MHGRLASLVEDLMAMPGLSGYEGRVRARLATEIEALGLAHRTDSLGNLIATIDGDPAAPTAMLFAHMDQLGFVVRRIDADGFIRVERLGGVPERALAAQAVLFQIGKDRDIPGVIANKSHHATQPDEKYRVVPYQDLYIDAGFSTAEEANAAGIQIGTPVVYLPRSFRVGEHRLAGAAVDDRAGCAVVVEVARNIIAADRRPTVHIVFSVQEEFNLRGAITAAQALMPAVAIQIDLILATDTPDMGDSGDIRLGAGPAMSMYSFHGRGTLNGLIPHPAMVELFDQSADALSIPLQRSAHTGALTETSYVQLVGEGIACIDMGFPMRYSHSALEVCDLRDLGELTRLVTAAITRIGPDFTLDRDRFPQ